MSLRLVAILMACAAVWLNGCTAPLKIAIFNNAGREIEVRTEPALPLGPRYASLAPGEILTDLQDRMLPPGLVIRVGPCEYGYDLPVLNSDYFAPGLPSHGELKVQLEPDLALYLLPVTAKRRLPMSRLTAVQRDGFPLRPVFDTCS